MSASYWESQVERHPLPIDESVAHKLKQCGSDYFDLARMEPAEIMRIMTSRFKFPQFPHLQLLGDTILGFTLDALSLWNFPDGTTGDAYLTLTTGGNSIFIPPPSRLTERSQTLFPFESVPGLKEFIECFGGMVDGSLPPGSHFYSGRDELFVKMDDEDYHWGPTGIWEGAFALYHGGTGDHVVINREGVPAKWLHEYGWGWDAEDSGAEDPFCEIDLDFAGLITHYSEYILLPPKDSRLQQSPFCY